MKRILSVMVVIATLPAFAPAQAQTPSLDDLFTRVSPTVVVVRSKGRDVGAGGITRFTETGSGVLVSSDGKVMTAAHVVNGMDEITVEGIGGEVVRATIVSANAAADVSLLQLERVTKAMRVARIGDSDTMRVGQQVMVVGAPYGLAYSMSVGWISARWPPNTIFPDMPLAEFLQTTATINTGNSGGPVFNMAGEVIGIVSQNISKSGGSEGLGFVVDQQRAKAPARPEGVLGVPSRASCSPATSRLSSMSLRPPGSSSRRSLKARWRGPWACRGATGSSPSAGRR
jgi:serine protease Do